eukprot:839914-Prorocentrum_minimum.AAC.1
MRPIELLRLCKVRHRLRLHHRPQHRPARTLHAAHAPGAAVRARGVLHRIALPPARLRPRGAAAAVSAAAHVLLGLILVGLVRLPALPLEDHTEGRVHRLRGLALGHLADAPERG